MMNEVSCMSCVIQQGHMIIADFEIELTLKKFRSQ